MLKRHLIFLSFFTLLLNNVSAAVKPFIFYKQSIAPGQKAMISIKVGDGKDSTIIPVTVFHGTKPGPVLGIIAGVHGYEYPPIVGVQQFSKELDPAQLSGTVILVHMANVPAFLGRTIEFNPQDGKNLNRIFPGKADGTITERMATVIGSEIIAKCDYLIDVHSGDAQNDLMPYAGYYSYTNRAALSEKGRQFAVMLGFDTIVKFGNEADFEGPSKYCSREAISRNIPAVDIECGRFGMAEPVFVSRIVKALHAAVTGLKMVKGTPPQIAAPTYIEKRTSMESEHTGFFFPAVKAGQRISKGEQLGYITDLFVNLQQEVISPVNGLVLYMNATPPISRGEEFFSIGHLD